MALIGPKTSGKTTMAFEAARAVAGDGQQSVWYICQRSKMESHPPAPMPTAAAAADDPSLTQIQWMAPELARIHLK